VLVGRVKVRTNLVRLQAVLLRLAAEPRRRIGKIFARRFSGQQQGGAFCVAGIGAGAAVGDEDESSPLPRCRRRGRLLVLKTLGKSLRNSSEPPLLLAAAATPRTSSMDDKDPPSSRRLRAVGEALGSLLLSLLLERLAGEVSSRCGKGLGCRLVDLLARDACEEPPRPGGPAAGSLSGLPGGAGEQQDEDSFCSAHTAGGGSAGGLWADG
jgi:hypothetical protein